jgi:DNA-binding NarL/FixJ family response regulator
MEKTSLVPLSGSDEGLPDDFEIGRRSPTHSRLAGEIGAAIAHELNGPMTALLLYVGDIQQSCDRLADKSLKRVVDGAVLEAERICALVHKIGDSFEAPIPKDTAISVARDAITWWARAGQPDGKVAADVGDQAFNEFARSGTKPLTPREREVLRLVVQGHSNKEGAALMKISYRTFECHRAGVIRKLGARNTAELVRLALLDTMSDSTPQEEARRGAGRSGRKSFRPIGSHSVSGRIGEAAMAAIRILHIDDEADIREVMEISLGLDPDFFTRSCESGPEGVKIAAEWDPDLILLDVMMPIMDGPATLSALRENPTTADIPVIFMTARAQARELDRFRSLGAVGVIAKPFDPMTLASSVRNYLQPAGDPLADLKVRFLRRVARDIAALAEKRSALKHGNPPSRSLERIRDVAHSLSGAGGIYGFPDISDAAADVEDAALALLEAAGSGERLSGALDRLIALAPSKEGPAGDTATGGIRVST